MKPTIIALDLEGTLISNAVTQFPRPGLRTFIDECADYVQPVQEPQWAPIDQFAPPTTRPMAAWLQPWWP